MKYLFLLPVLFYLGCSTGEGPKQYNLGDNYFLLMPLSTNSIEILLDMYNQRAESSTGRDRVTKPTADLTVPISATPAP